MILVENKELLIPNNERYIGTTQDADSENRLFRVRRVTQSGVDIAHLTFRLDLKYPQARKVYSFTTSTSRTGRIVRVSAKSWTRTYQDAGTYTFTYNGSSWTCGGQTVDLISVGVRAYFTPAKGDTVTVKATISQAEGDTVILWKEITDEYINLTWQISEAQLAIPGLVWLSLRASDGGGTVRWASYYGTLYVEENGYVPSDYTGSLSELEQLENDLSQHIATMEYLIDKGTAYGDEAEAWAVGTRSGVPVAEGDETYNNNAEYYAEHAASEIETASASTLAAAAASASEAKEAEKMAKKYRDEAAEKIDDTTASTSTVYSSSKTEAVIAGQWTAVHTW